MNFWNQSSNNLFKAENKSFRARCEICLKLAIKTPEQCRPSGILNFEHIAHIVSLSLLLTLNR